MSAQHRRTASAWHDGQWSALYAYASSGSITRGLDSEIVECLDTVERGDLDLELDPVVEHERLLALFQEIEPEIARLSAEDLGADDGERSAAWWEQDTIGGRATGDTKAVAQRVLDGVEDGDPEVLDSLMDTVSFSSQEEIEAQCGWDEPDLDDWNAHVRWERERLIIWDAYWGALQESFEAGVVVACRRELADPERAIPGAAHSRRLEVDERHLAVARHMGAGAAAAEASGHRLTGAEATAILNERHDINPPALTQEWGGHPTPTRLAEEILDRRLDDIQPGHRDAIAALAEAWEVGRDIVWDTALRASALRTLGRADDALPLEQTCASRLRMLDGASTSAAAERRPGPYLRPADNTHGEDLVSDRSAPAGWVVEPVGLWEGTEQEVVYDPRRNDFALTESTPDRSPTPSSGWELAAVDGPRCFWTLDRVTAARESLGRFNQLALGAEPRSPEIGAPLELGR